MARDLTAWADELASITTDTRSLDNAALRALAAVLRAVAGVDYSEACRCDRCSLTRAVLAALAPLAPLFPDTEGDGDG